MLQSWDADGHIEEWEGTFSDRYFEQAYRDRRPVVVDPKGDGFYFWKIDGRPDLFKRGGSPTSKADVPSTEQRRLAQWRGTVESAEFRSAAARTATMDQEHIQVQVNYPTMLLQWPVSFDPALNGAITRSYNNWMADISSQDAARMKWVSALDFFDAEAAAKEVERTKKLGAIGIMLFGVIGEKPITDPSFEPIWAAAAQMGMAVAIHPGRASSNLGAQQFHFSVLSGFQHVVTSGVLDRYSNLRVGFLETSCQWVDFMVWRAEEELDFVVERRAAGIETGRTVPLMKPDEYIRSGRLYFGFEVEDHILPYMVDRWGADVWLYASDIPHGHRILDATSHFLARKDLTEDVKRQLLIDNTARFYDLPLP